jgi:hypothetical protein
MYAEKLFRSERFKHQALCCLYTQTSRIVAHNMTSRQFCNKLHCYCGKIFCTCIIWHLSPHDITEHYGLNI